MKALDYFAAQTLVTTELRTREMNLLPASIREAAHWSSEVDNIEVLQLMQDVAKRETAGELSRTESRKELRLGLNRLGYQPKPGTEGTIKDLMSVERQNRYLDTVKAQARGFMNWNKRQAALKYYPAVRLIRLQEKKEYRDWVSLFNNARASTKEEGAEMALRSWTEKVGEPGPICLLNHPLLPYLSDFGLPYDPLKWGTGMRQEEVSMEDAQNAGVIEDGVEEMLRPQVRSLNQNLQMKPEIRDAELKARVSDKLRGFAEWQGDTLKFTDPNGLRPLDPQDVRKTIASDLPAGFEQLQLAAVQNYVTRPGTILRTPWTDTARDFSRLLHRVEPNAVVPSLDGIIPLTAADVTSFVDAIKNAPAALPVPLQLSSGTLNQAGVNVRVVDAPGVKDLGYVWQEYREDMKFLEAGTRLEFVGQESDGTILLRVVRETLKSALQLLLALG